MKSLFRLGIVSLLAVSTAHSQVGGGETLRPLAGGTAPTSHAELWAGFDPRKEPLEVEVLHGWEEEGVVLRVIRYRVGVFKGKKAWMAAVFGYPKGASRLPGLAKVLRLPVAGAMESMVAVSGLYSRTLPPS